MTFRAILVVIMFFSIFLFSIPLSRTAAQTDRITGTCVKNVNGAPAIVVQYGKNERVLDDITYISYNYYEKNVKHMAENGSNSFGFMLNLGNSSPHWTRPIWGGKTARGLNIYSYDLLDQRIEMTIRAKSDAKILIRFYVGVPLAWLNEHPEEQVIVKDRNGGSSNRYATSSTVSGDQSYPTMYSDVVLSEMGQALADIVKRTEEKYGGNILGYTLSGLGSEEWYAFGWHNERFDDYSSQAEEKFKDFLRNKYGTDEALRTAWRKNKAFTFNDVKIPDPSRRINSGGMFYNVETEMDVVDFYQFYNEHVPDSIISLSKSIKKVCPNKVVGAIYGYQMEFGSDSSSNHNALGKLVDSPYIDFVKFEAGEEYRVVGAGGDNYRGPLDTIRVAGKVALLDNDTITHRTAECDTYRGRSAAELQAIANAAAVTNGATTNAVDAANMQKRIIGFAIANSFTATFFDLHGAYYQDTFLRRSMANIESVYSRSFQSNRASAAEILIVSDENSLYYSRVQGDLGNNYLFNESHKTIRNLMFVGAPYDIVLTRDLAKINLDQYKMVLFFCPYHVSDEDLKCINLAKGGGRTLYFTYAPGLFCDAKRTHERMKLVTGLNIVSAGKTGINKVTIEKNDERFSKGFFTDYHNPYVENVKQATISTNQAVELFTVNDPDAVVVGKNDNLNVMAYKRMTGERGEYTSVYIPFAGFTVELLRAYARFAGVQIYTDVYKPDGALGKYDNVNIGREYVTIHADGARERTLYFPKKVDVYDAISNKLIKSDASSVTLSMQNAETMMLRVLAPGTDPDAALSRNSEPSSASLSSVPASASESASKSDKSASSADSDTTASHSSESSSASLSTPASASENDESASNAENKSITPSGQISLKSFIWMCIGAVIFSVCIVGVTIWMKKKKSTS